MDGSELFIIPICFVLCLYFYECLYEYFVIFLKYKIVFYKQPYQYQCFIPSKLIPINFSFFAQWKWVSQDKYTAEKWPLSNDLLHWNNHIQMTWK